MNKAEIKSPARKADISNNKKPKKPKIRGLVLLPVVSLLYLVLYTYAPEKTMAAVDKSLSILVHLLPVFLTVIIIMGAIAALMQSRNRAGLLAKESGLKGWFIAVVGGILSHGSAYIWYQMLADLRAHNVRDSLIITFLYTRAIKLPWLPLMVSYFGLSFTVLLTIYIILGAIIQGLIVARMSSDGHLS